MLGLQDAATNNKIEIMQLLVDNNMTIDSTVMEETWSIETFTLFFEHGLDINQK